MTRPYAYPAKYNAVDMFSGRTGQGGLARQDQVGFTAPARIWAKMDDIERSAASLNRDIDTNVRDPGFIAGWKQWYSNWRRDYYDKYQSTLARLGALSGSDELNAAVERQRETLRGWYESYTRQRLPDGSPVPFPSGLPPARMGADPNTNAGWSLPWWFWLATGAAALFIGYRFYVRYTQLRNQTKLAEEKLLPAVFERYGIPGREATEVVRAGHRDLSAHPSAYGDPFSAPSLGRDPAASSPLSLAFYARDAQGFELPAYGYESRDAQADRYDEPPNFTYDRSRDPLAGRFR